ncbi:TPA: hypothetical protein ACX6SG_002565 [Photobacterium damselae]
MNNLCLSSGVEVDRANNTLISGLYAYQLEPELIDLIAEKRLSELSSDDVARLMHVGLVFQKQPELLREIHWSEMCETLKSSVVGAMRDEGKDSFMQKIIAGQATKQQAEAWVRSMFDFTKLATDHIGHIVQIHSNGDTEDSRAYWQQFLEEEKNHWQIYTRIFKYMGLDIVQEYDRNPYPQVRRFVNFLKEAANESEQHYASLLFMVETGAGCNSLQDDPQFYSLVEHYGFPYDVVNPLFLHTKLNDDIEHSNIWREVISKKETYTHSEVTSITLFALTHLKLSRNWIDSLERI